MELRVDLLQPMPRMGRRKSMNQQGLHGSRQEAGIALLIVMIMVLVLSVLAGGFAFSMKVETKLAKNTALDTDLQWLGRSGVELARYVLSQQSSIPEPFDSLKQKWAGGPGNTNDLLAEISLENNVVGDGTFSIKIIDAERKLNINSANDAVIQQALTLIGVDASTFSMIVDSIKDWRDRDDSQSMAGAESDYYLSLSPPYVAKNGPIGDLTELLLVKGVTPEIFWGPQATNRLAGGLGALAAAAPFQQALPPPTGGRSARTGVTSRNPGFGLQGYGVAAMPVGLVDLFSAVGARQINLNTASAAVLQLIPGVDAHMAGAIVQARSGYDGAEGTLDDTPFASPSEVAGVPGFSPQLAGVFGQFCTVRSFTFEVHVDAEINGYHRRFIALLRRMNARDIQTLYMHWE
ncbi:MAG: general secretion pathway protein GspK [Verrucomicrobia bacterium]|nr:general secretion pathway protein GspK [Verrucomicrobiota bacterium]